MIKREFKHLIKSNILKIYYIKQKIANIYSFLVNCVKGIYIIFINNLILLKDLNIEYLYNLVKGKVDNYFKLSISQKSQAYLITQMLNKGILLPDEEEAFRHGRNSHVSSRRKNIDIQTYLLATGFEAVFGYLYFKEKKDRINELINYIFSVGEIPNE
jgi:ribonuclease-3 family protein